MDEFLEVLEGVLANSGIHYRTKERIIAKTKLALAKRAEPPTHQPPAPRVTKKKSKFGR